MIVGGLLTSPIDLSLKAFCGVGYELGSTPLDLLAIYFLSGDVENFSILLVDEFLRMNGTDEAVVLEGRNALEKTFNRLSDIYGLDPAILRCSDFMNTENYHFTHREIKEAIGKDPQLQERVRKTVPERKRTSTIASEYPIHEISCIRFLSEAGIKMKIGPSKEKAYDVIAKELGLDTDFNYLTPAFALGTGRHNDEVVHYIPSSRGPNNGQRVLFEDDEEKVKKKLSQGNETALRYFAKLALIAAELRGNLDKKLEYESITKLNERRLKRKTIDLVLENIVGPFKEKEEGYC